MTSTGDAKSADGAGDQARRDEAAAALTGAIARGHAEAFGLLYDQWFDRLCRWAGRATGRDESFCMDIVQDAMIRVMKRMPALPTEAALATWLHRAVLSSCKDRLRADHRRLLRERAKHEAAVLESDRSAELVAQRLEWINDRVGQLHREAGPLVRLRYSLGWTLTQIAAALGVAPSTADRRLKRAIADLRRHAQEEFHE